MKKLIFDKNSWHYKVAYKMTSFNPDNYSDKNPISICDYMTYVLKGLIPMTLAASCIIFAAVTMSYAAYIIFIALFLHNTTFFNNPETIGMFGIVEWAFVIGGGCIFLLYKSVKVGVSQLRKHMPVHVPAPPKPPKPDGFVKQAWKAWKRNVCVPIEFRE